MLYLVLALKHYVNISINFMIFILALKKEINEFMHMCVFGCLEH